MNRHIPFRSKLLVNGLLVAMMLYSLFPIWWLLISATKSNSDLFASNGWWFAEPHFRQNLETVLTYGDGIFTRWLGNSVLYSGVAMIGGTLISVGAGYALSKFDFPSKRLISGIVVAALLIPGTLITIPLYFVAASVGLSNSMLAIIIPSLISPFGVFLARVYCDSAIPNELLEAGRIDGAGEFRIFFTVALRILTPVMVTIGLFIFVGTWNNFMLPLVMLKDQELWPVSLGLYGWQSFRGVSPYERVLTGSVLAVIPLVALFFTLQKYWRSGLTLGSVKA